MPDYARSKKKQLATEKQVATTELDWRDYVAFVIALLQTNLLPSILLVMVFALILIFVFSIWLR